MKALSDWFQRQGYNKIITIQKRSLVSGKIVFPSEAVAHDGKSRCLWPSSSFLGLTWLYGIYDEHYHKMINQAVGSHSGWQCRQYLSMLDSV